MNISNDKWLQEYNKQIINLVSFFEQDVKSNQRMFNYYKEIVESNNSIGFPKGARFHLWVERNHFYALYAGLRKMFFGRDVKENSLLTIIESLLNDGMTLTRADYAKSLKLPDANIESIISNLFDTNGHLNGEALMQDKTTILEIKSKLQFINQGVLHIQKKQKALVPKSDDVDKSIESLSVLLKKYELFLTGAHIAWALPEYGWVDIFTEPWINDIV